MKENNSLREYYNKKYSIITYSGTLAIESVLRTLNLNKNDKVLISSLTCYSVLEAVINSGLTPFIATPSNRFLFTKEELLNIFKKYNIKVYIAVHQYGYYQEFPVCSDVIIIEDCSQCFNIMKDNKNIEYLGDYIIQSFGKTKPLSYGIGGIICSNVDISKYFDMKNREDRNKEHPLIEYLYPLKIVENSLMNKGFKKVDRARNIANKLHEVLSKYKEFDIVSNNDYYPSYHRFVVKIKKNDKDKVSKMLDEAQINYQYEFRIGLHQIPIAIKNNIKYISSESDTILLLIKTDNPLYKIKRLDKILGVYYEKVS